MISRSETLAAVGFLLFWVGPALRADAIGTANAPMKVPEDFPNDFPVYKHAEIKRYGPMVPASPKLGNVLILETPDSKAEVLEFYSQELAAKGWSVEKPLSTAPDSLTACKSERRISVNVLDSQSGGKHVTVIQLGVNSTP